MLKLTILPSGDTVQVQGGETVRDALSRLGIEIEGPCNGKGICGQCHIWVENPEDVPETPHENLTREQLRKGLRLACRVIPQSDLTIRLPDDVCIDEDKTHHREQYQILEGNQFSDIPSAPRQSTRTEPSLEEKPEPAAFVYKDNGVNWIRYNRKIKKRLDVWQDGFLPKGLAVDLGTTTLVLTLVSLHSGKELATASALNPQIRFGHDVMTRIQVGSSPEGLAGLTEAVRTGLNHLVKEVCADSKSQSSEVLDVVIGGNTTMLELAAGINPAPLGHVPFTVDINGGQSYGIQHFGLDVNPAAQVYIPPITHAFVGSDISAGLLVCNGFFRPEGSVLFVDVGTNGEIGLSREGHRIVTSTAAGPAFEGMGLSSGKRAGVGAVERVETDGEAIRTYTVGNAPAKGICGSGIIDLTACLLRLGIVDYTGRMKDSKDKKDLSPHVASDLVELGGKPAFRIGEEVYFTQEDLRKVQLAKSAIRTAIDMLLEKIGTTMPQEVFVAGGFGRSLRPESLEDIGMIPRGMGSRTSFLGNTSRLGCSRLLLNTSVRGFIEQQMAEVEHVQLVDDPDYMDRFVENINFPLFHG